VTGAGEREATSNTHELTNVQLAAGIALFPSAALYDHSLHTSPGDSKTNRLFEALSLHERKYLSALNLYTKQPVPSIVLTASLSSDIVD
jgi:hypothetical protein